MTEVADRAEAVKLQRLFREHPEHLTPEQIAAFAHEQLQGEEHQIVLAHVVYCVDCMADVAAARSVLHEVEQAGQSDDDTPQSQ